MQHIHTVTSQIACSNEVTLQSANTGTFSYLTPSFIKSHLHHSIHNPDILLVFINGSFSYNEPLRFTAHSSRSPHLQATNFINPPPLVANIHNPQFNEVIGSVNGLICFSIDIGRKYGIYIWNPSLSAIIDIPPFTTPVDSYDSSVLLRFGFDPKNDDYKVLMVTFCQGSNGTLVTGSLQVEVYSTRKSSRESINVIFPSHITYICNRSEVVVDGHDGRLHWICYVDLDWQEQTIVAFDLGAETFTEIALPDSIQFGAFNSLGVLSQKLCVISLSKGDGDCEVWLMDNKSWVKHLHICKQQVHGIITPLGFTSSNEFLCELDDDDIALYDPNTAAVKSFKIKSMTTGIVTRLSHQTTKIVPYVDSLVWPGNSTKGVAI